MPNCACVLQSRGKFSCITGRTENSMNYRSWAWKHRNEILVVNHNVPKSCLVTIAGRFCRSRHSQVHGLVWELHMCGFQTRLLSDPGKLNKNVVLLMNVLVCNFVKIMSMLASNDTTAAKLDKWNHSVYGSLLLSSFMYSIYQVDSEQTVALPSEAETRFSLKFCR